MTRKRFKRLWAFLRLYLVLRELKRRRPPVAPMAFALLLLGCAFADAPAVRDPIVVVMRDGLPNCSGFAIERNTVLTAAHCVGDENEVDVVTEEQWRTTASASTHAVVAFRDRGRDLATLSGEFNFDMYVSFRALREREPVYSRSVYFGAMTDGNLLDGAGYFRDSDMTIAKGWSGSPVFGLDGKVVGLVHSCVARERQCLPFNAQIAVLP